MHITIRQTPKACQCVQAPGCGWQSLARRLQWSSAPCRPCSCDRWRTSPPAMSWHILDLLCRCDRRRCTRLHMAYDARVHVRAIGFRCCSGTRAARMLQHFSTLRLSYRQLLLSHKAPHHAARPVHEALGRADVSQQHDLSAHLQFQHLRRLHNLKVAVSCAAEATRPVPRTDAAHRRQQA